MEAAAIACRNNNNDDAGNHQQHSPDAQDKRQELFASLAVGFDRIVDSHTGHPFPGRATARVALPNLVKPFYLNLIDFASREKGGEIEEKPAF